MQVASLFAKLGIRGGSAAGAEANALKKGLEGAKGAASATVQVLANLSASLGLSTKSLQAYQFAAAKVGVSNRELATTFQGIQSAAAKASTAKTMPKHVQRLAEVTGGNANALGADDMKRFAAQPAALLQQLQEYSRLEHNAGVRAQTLKGFGVTGGMVGAVNRQAFRPEILQKAPGYNGKDLREAKELWSNVGKEATGALKGVNEGIRGTASASFTAKAAVVGFTYALQKLFATSGKAGTSITNFKALTGMGEQELQRHQYAGRQAGASNEDVSGGLAALQNTAFNTVIGKGAPEFIELVNKRVGRITANDMRKYSEDPAALLQKLQLFAKRETNVPLRNQALKSFGLNDAMIAALVRQAFTPEQMAKAPTYSDKEVKALDKSNVAWANLGNKVEMAIGHFNAAHGAELVKAIGPIVDSLLRLANALADFAKKAKVFEAIGLVIKGWTAIFGGAADVATTITDAVSDDPKKKEKTQKKAIDLVETFKSMTSYLEDLAKEKLGLNGGEASPKPKPVPNEKKAAMPVNLKDEGGGGGGDGGGGGSGFGSGGEAPGLTPTAIAAPPMPAAIGNNSTQNIEVNQNLNFAHEGKDAQATGSSVAKAVRDAYRQLPAQSQGS